MERLSERRFETLFEQAPFSLQLIAKDGRTLRVNRAWRDLWQLADADGGVAFVLERYNIWQDTQLEASGTLDLLRRAFAGESVRTPPTRYDPAQTGKPGRIRWVVGHVHPVRNPAGEITEVMLIHEDVTERLVAENELRASERRLQALANTIPQLAWMATPDGDIHWFNERWYQYTGTTPDQMRHGGWAAVHHPDWLEEVERGWRQMAANGEPGHMSFPLRGADGVYRTFLALVAPLRDEQGKVTQWFGTNTDITPLQEAEAGLRRAEERLRLAIEAGNIGIWEWHLEHDIVSWSDQTYALHGMTPGSFGGRAQDFQALVHPDDLPGLWSRVQTAIDQQDGFTAEFRVVLPDGRHRWLSTWARLHRDARGAAVRMVGATISVDDHKRIQTRLLDGERRKDEFLAMLAHELRNPLAPIASAAQLLAGSETEDPRVRFASQVITRQVAHLTQLVDDLIDVSRVTRGLAALEFEPLELRPLIEAAIEQVRSLLDAKGHQLVVRGLDVPVWLRADRTRAVQVITNLLNNAARYTPSPGRIEVQVESSGAAPVRIDILDDGQGIDAELLERIFEPFTQGARTPDRAQGGLGIGLTLVKSLVSLHGGTVEAHSAGPGRGSRFRVSLPVIAAPPAGVEPPSAERRRERAPARSLVVVDDNVDAATTLAALLETQGHAVAVFHDARSVLEARFPAPPDAIFLDIGLPDLDGLELARRLRQRPEMRRATFVALTGYGQPEDRRRSRAAGFDHHLVKPAETAALERLLLDVGT